jgi:hypothetical protein
MPPSKFSGQIPDSEQKEMIKNAANTGVALETKRQHKH